MERNGSEPQTSVNPLEAYFEAHVVGRGIWKWRHYFDIYHRHLAKYIGLEVNVLEIGIYSGGSIDMWRSYFGDRANIFGVDIEDACIAYEGDGVRIFIGDQADPEFWARFRAEVPNIDVVIDDGGHQPDQQIATLEALLPHLRPGGIFICEDVIGVLNPFQQYVCGLMCSMNARGSAPNPVQRSIKAISIYPYVTVIERRERPLEELVSPKHGTEWQPFLDIS